MIRLLFTAYYPPVLLLVFLGCLYSMEMPAKGTFLARDMLALVVATFLAHVNRIFGLWPAHLLFPSGHTTFCLGLSVSLAMLRPWTLALTLPLLLFLTLSLVTLHFHSVFDILGAFPLVLVIYGTIHWLWPLPTGAPPLDSSEVSL
jgi:membrane-associated phospholipid phosphatase